MTHKDIANTIEKKAPLYLQESYDNCGFQVGNPDDKCLGVIICVDATEDILDEAVEKGCNLVVTHHPLLFHAQKQILARHRMDYVLRKAIKADITIYSCHTAIDNAPTLGVSIIDAQMLKLNNIQPIAASGEKIGPVVGELPFEMASTEAIKYVKDTFSCTAARVSYHSAERSIKKIAIGGGACGDFIIDAIANGADMFVTSDCKHNLFLDYQKDIILMDLGHFDTEKCTKEIFYNIITEKFPNFAVYKSQREKNPIIYC